MKPDPNTELIRISVSLYGTLSRFLGGKHVGSAEIEVASGTTKGELLRQLGIPEDERGYLFINSVLCDVPGLSTGDGQVLNNSDHIGVFSIDRMWPYQYRDGVRMSPELTAALKEHGAMHHTYTHLKN